MTLSKSDYLLFLKHPAWLWLKKHDKAKLPKITDSVQAVFDAGNLFETYAEKLFPTGVRVGFSAYDEYLSQPLRTTQAIAAGEKVLFQARFEAEGLTCICDVVEFLDDRTLNLYEIKSTSEAKQIHEYDLAFQAHILRACGYTVARSEVLCVNAEYVRLGEIDPSQFVLRQDVTNAVIELMEETARLIKQAIDVANHPVIPDTNPIHCKFQSLSEWVEIYRALTPVADGSVYDLCRLNVELLEKLDEQGITAIADIPDTMELKEQQARQVKAVQENRVHVDGEQIRSFLAGCAYPLYFLDYETFSGVVPLFDGLRPYQQVPFQYSLHILDTPGAALRHTGYLHRERSNPVRTLSAALGRDIGQTGTVIVWFEGFEKSRNTEMGELVPELREFYEQLNGRVVDLMVPFARGWYVHKDFRGSASIKKVLPVLVPELSFAALDIHEGGTAQRLWMEAVLDGKHDGEREKILHDLDEYCTLDTLAMVKIYEQLLKA